MKNNKPDHEKAIRHAADAVQVAAVVGIARIRAAGAIIRQVSQPKIFTAKYLCPLILSE